MSSRPSLDLWRLFPLIVLEGEGGENLVRPGHVRCPSPSNKLGRSFFFPCNAAQTARQGQTRARTTNQHHSTTAQTTKQPPRDRYNHRSTVIYRPHVVHADGPRYPHVHATASTRKHVHMTRISSVNHARRGVLHVARACECGSESTDICDVGGLYVRFGGASDRPMCLVGCGGAQVPPHTPTATHKHRSQCAVGVQNRSQEGA